MTRIAIIGAGAVGTAFAQITADAGNSVRLLVRDPHVAKSIEARHRNPKRFPEIRFPRRVHASSDPKSALRGADLVFVAVGAQVAGTVLQPLAGHIPSGAVVVSLMKGVELGSGRRMSEVIKTSLDIEEDRIAVISGPNLAAEIVAREPAATVVASTSPEASKEVANAVATDYFRPYLNSDVIGVETGGAVKNVIAFAVGVAGGLGNGMNTRATLMTRGLAEMTRLGVALGAKAETFSGLTGVGDLHATCSSSYSRNHTVGRLVGEGKSVDEAVAATGQTAESIKSSAAILSLAQSHDVDMPITEAVVAVIHRGLDVVAMGRALMARPKRSEGLDYEPWG
ncbi:MAG: NAD(P)-dependent glycerol-3-phosphate dehydrogenase [Bifidobacteriaceae bacterium]|jgi:glycerol-3-phosphate dehydrogenase (NAD(P)+)|nr:NAD(P)-dependent glycerol-3-phosphate dehydrogenase [Bifidobacteriaceae bacterium]